MSIRHVPAAALFLGVCAGAAAAQDSSLQLTFGHLDVDSGLSDRDYASAFLRHGVSSGTELLFEVATQSREEDASFLSFGAAVDIGGGSSVSVSLGGSDSDLGIYPEWTVALGYEFVTPPATGLVYRAGLSYADYANGTESTTLSGEAVKFFPAFADGSFLVGQVGGSLVSSEPGSETGWSATAAVTYVQPGSWSVGLSASTGTIGYEPFNASPVENDFVALRPFVSFNASEATEIIVSAEYVDTETFDISGVALGLKLDF
ncbi:YaiO family outer membrane beta-barrel protein [Roseibacterium sp. SDUM158017]|uniref:YaiO family outer membrane beta-barrel protein n=1 Tax=Roseicyclus salinarum TaxID=3036773 RepID=UPI002414DF53|nr:YaiO family outer membrane beta-barrel protein [Roseibacterium sp. SDUM158017]MDG4648925.1 YaiO family outer membrane beta-barrel protein [Roseibacterium sp. SDUM158017]